MRVLLTGGAGFIGSHTAVALLERGHEVIVLDDFSNSSREPIRRVEELCGKQVTLHIADLTNAASTQKVFASESIDAVIHFAGLKSVGESVRDPLLYYRTNLMSTMVLLETMALAKVKKLVFSSSATVYGVAKDVPVSESSEVSYRLSNPYGQTKAMIEQIIRDAVVADSALQIAVLRYFNPVGAHTSGRIGEDPKQTPNNLLPFVSQVAVGLRDFVSVFGGGYDTPDGTGVRDYIHVMDLAEGHLAALAHLKSGVSTYNLGSGIGSSVLDVINTFSRVANRAIPYEVVAAREGDVSCSYADVTKATRELGWSTHRTLEDACRDAWRWQSGNPHGYASQASPRGVLAVSS
ncbi:UDP-glucose 4-epimerase GalE [Cryobacterium sp. 10I5]|uniref:UDP-glucose 4-epimerase GalE n=1 Tax=Cryobacterium sp. 10I5 TaxID=3048581 RepID=UPI002B23507F|nr:UDP-glucose 4-epimerase GalE [Cryobacterium sp. 10I5]MEB0265474.1 UDP-glucose 4-epimerase GalE [Cryobacterium sp. 10I5]